LRRRALTLTLSRERERGLARGCSLSLRERAGVRAAGAISPFFLAGIGQTDLESARWQK